MSIPEGDLVCRRREINRSELLNRNIGIYDENHRLVKGVLWGPVGVEAVLAQLFPPQISLFFDKMDVIKARAEAENFANTLKIHGVEVTKVRDQLALSLTPKSLTKGEIIDRLINKAKSIQEKYGTHQQSIENIIDFLVEDDIRRYGENAASTLNQTLSLSPELPLGNSIFARDQANMIMGKRIKASMAKPIRKKEVSLYEMVYNNMGLTDPILIPKGETFEGGDAYVHDGIVYIGVGARTTLEAALTIYQELYQELQEKGFRFAIVVDPDINSRGFREQMDFMHLDTFSTPLGQHQMLVCEEEVNRRRVWFVEDGQLVDSQRTFIKHLEDEGNELIVIPRQEQQNFGVNLLSLDDKTMFIPLDTNGITIKELIRLGKNVVNLDLVESTKGYGAAHCMLFQLKRH